MFELLVIAIGVLAVVGVALALRSRQGEGDPSSSVHAFNRALSAMEPGSGGRPRRPGGEGADGQRAADDDAERPATRDGDEVAGNPPRS